VAVVPDKTYGAEELELQGKALAATLGTTVRRTWVVEAVVLAVLVLMLGQAVPV
jgi:hypothetical protein